MFATRAFKRDAWPPKEIKVVRSLQSPRTKLDKIIIITIIITIITTTIITRREEETRDVIIIKLPSKPLKMSCRVL